MSNILNRVIGVFKSRRINVFLVFLVVAFSILIINKLSHSYTNTVEFQLKLTNVPNDIVLQDVEAYKLPVQFENTGFSWLKFVFNKPILELDFKKNFVQKKAYYSWSVVKNQEYIIKSLPRFSKNIKSLVDEVNLNYDRLASKKVAVESNVNINFMSGYDALQNLLIQPDSVVIVGSKGQVDKISKIKTKVLNLKNISSSISQTVRLELDSLSDSVKSSIKNVNLELEVEPFTEGQMKLPIEIRNKPQDISITFFPKQVNVSYYLPLKYYKLVNQKSFKVFFDYKNLSVLDNYLKPELEIITDKIKTARIKESKVEFIITK